jgi:hypothetical protein
VQYVAHRGNFCFSYHLIAQLCNLRTVLNYNMCRIGENSALDITNRKTLWGGKGVRVQYVAHRGILCFFYHVSSQFFNVGTVLMCNMFAERGIFCLCFHLRHKYVTWEQCWSTVCDAFRNFLLLLSLNSSTLWRENGVRVKYLAQRGIFCLCYQLTAQLSDVRTVLLCIMWG